MYGSVAVVVIAGMREKVGPLLVLGLVVGSLGALIPHRMENATSLVQLSEDHTARHGLEQSSYADFAEIAQQHNSSVFIPEEGPVSPFTISEVHPESPGFKTKEQPFLSSEEHRNSSIPELVKFVNHSSTLWSEEHNNSAILQLKDHGNSSTPALLGHLSSLPLSEDHENSSLSPFDKHLSTSGQNKEANHTSHIVSPQKRFTFSILQSKKHLYPPSSQSDEQSEHVLPSSARSDDSEGLIADCEKLCGICNATGRVANGSCRCFSDNGGELVCLRSARQSGLEPQQESEEDQLLSGEAEGERGERCLLGTVSSRGALHSVLGQGLNEMTPADRTALFRKRVESLRSLSALSLTQTELLNEEDESDPVAEAPEFPQTSLPVSSLSTKPLVLKLPQTSLPVTPLSTKPLDLELPQTSLPVSTLPIKPLVPKLPQTSLPVSSLSVKPSVLKFPKTSLPVAPLSIKPLVPQLPQTSLPVAPLSIKPLIPELPKTSLPVAPLSIKPLIPELPQTSLSGAPLSIKPLVPSQPKNSFPVSSLSIKPLIRDLPKSALPVSPFPTQSLAPVVKGSSETVKVAVEMGKGANGNIFNSLGAVKQPSSCSSETSVDEDLEVEAYDAKVPSAQPLMAPKINLPVSPFPKKPLVPLVKLTQESANNPVEFKSSVLKAKNVVNLPIVKSSDSQQLDRDGTENLETETVEASKGQLPKFPKLNLPFSSLKKTPLVPVVQETQDSEIKHGIAANKGGIVEAVKSADLIKPHFSDEKWDPQVPMGRSVNGGLSPTAKLQLADASSKLPASFLVPDLEDRLAKTESVAVIGDFGDLQSGLDFSNPPVPSFDDQGSLAPSTFAQSLINPNSFVSRPITSTTTSNDPIPAVTNYQLPQFIIETPSYPSDSYTKMASAAADKAFYPPKGQVVSILGSPGRGPSKGNLALPQNIFRNAERDFRNVGEMVNIMNDMQRPMI